MGVNIFISGSVAKGIWSGKDIDLVYLTQDAGYVYSESFVVRNMMFQVVYIPIYKLIDIISFDLLSSDRIYINILKGSVPINHDDSVKLAEIKEYIGYMETKIRSFADNDILYHVTHIQELCSEISDIQNNAIVLASDLFLTLLRFITERHHTASKHLGRAVDQNASAQKIGLKYIEAMKKGDFEDFTETARMVISPFLVDEGRVSTGVSYNVPSSHSCIIYIPCERSKTNRAKEILSDLENCCEDCLAYSFYIGQNQVMDCGTYLFIRFADSLDSHMIMDRLCDVHEKYAEICVAEDLKIIFPYNTAFSSGYYFGGYDIFESLIPLFCMLHKNIRKDNDEKIVSGIQICNAWLEKVDCSLMEKYLEYLALYAVDPNGIYNTRQVRYMKQALNRFYMRQSTNLCTCIDSSDELTCLINAIIRIAKELEDSEIHFIGTPLSDDRKEILLVNILDHLLSVCMLDADEKYAVVYHSLKTRQ